MKKQPLEKQFIDEISQGNFEEGLELLPTLDELTEPVRSVLSNAAYDANLAAYAFMLFLLTKTRAISIYQEACFMAQMSINYLNGAYESSAHHARMAFEASLPQNPIIGGTLLCLYILPEQPISTAEAVYVAKKILAVEPENDRVKEILQEALSRADEPVAPPRNERDQLERLIRQGLFTKAKELLPSLSTRELHEILIYLGCEERNLCAYTFIWFLMQEQEAAELHYIAYRIITLAWPPLNMKGCHATGAFHLRRAMHLDSANIKYAEHFLMLHTPPPHPSNVINDEVAESIARRTLSLEAGVFSAAAKRVLRSLGKTE